MSEGRKDDQGKLPYDLLPPELLAATAAVLNFGKGKYGARNWEQGMAWSRPFAALMRHMWAWWRGEHVDPETGMSHLWHASCCIAFLIAYEQRRIGADDRPICNVSARNPIRGPDGHIFEMPLPPPLSCVWPEEEEQP